MRAIDMHDLQTLTAGAIQALPRAVPIKNGTVTIGFLLPVRGAQKEALRDVLAEIDAAAAAYTPEQNAAIDALLRERGAE